MTVFGITIAPDARDSLKDFIAEVKVALAKPTIAPISFGFTPEPGDGSPTFISNFWTSFEVKTGNSQVAKFNLGNIPAPGKRAEYKVQTTHPRNGLFQERPVASRDIRALTGAYFSIYNGSTELVCPQNVAEGIKPSGIDALYASRAIRAAVLSIRSL